MAKRKKDKDITTIGITVKTKRNLLKLKKYGETFDEQLRRMIKDKRGQADVMFLIVIVSIVTGISFTVLGMIMDKLVKIHNTSFGYPISYAQTEAISNQITIFHALPFIILILLTFAVIKISVSRRSGEV